jgi:RNA polymerase sigma-70 factor (ECF subfamily)
MAAIDASTLDPSDLSEPGKMPATSDRAVSNDQWRQSHAPASGEAVSPEAVVPDTTSGSREKSRDDSRLGHAERSMAAERLVEQFHADVFRYSYWLSGCRNAAEDITQETFLRAYRGLHALREMAAAKGWLLTIARHEYLRWIRKSSELSSEFEVDEADGKNHTLQLEQQDWLMQALDRLPTEFRVVLLMYYFEQRSYAEIANDLDIPLGTVMSRLSRARQHLRNSLEQLETPKRER